MQRQFKPSGIPELDSDVQTILHLENGNRTGSVTLTNNAITVALKTLGTCKSAKRNQVNKLMSSPQKATTTHEQYWPAQ
jgi:hypothetical protein